jgi:GAF domain-containing protein
MSHSSRARALIALAAVQGGAASITLLLGGSALSEKLPPPFSLGFYLANLVFFGGGAILFLVAGRRDVRAVDLGATYLLIAAVFADLPIEKHFEGIETPLSSVVRFVMDLEVEAFLPWFLWRFVLQFPSAHLTYRWRRVGAFALATTLALGVFAFVANVLEHLVGDRVPILAGIDRDLTDSAFFLLIFVFLIAALAALAMRWRGEEGENRRRLGLFFGALLLGFGPLFAWILFEALGGLFWSGLTKFATAHRLTLLAIFYPPFWTVPFSTAYAVLVHRVLDFRALAQRSIEHALARTTVALATAAPLLGLAVYLYAHRSSRLDELASFGRVPFLAALGVLGGVALYYRQRWLEAIDRRFFRERYDARQILTDLVERVRQTRDRLDLVDLVSAGIDRSLHPSRCAILLAEPDGGPLSDPHKRSRRLADDSALARWMAGSPAPLSIDPEAPRTAFEDLPESDRHWLIDGGFRLLVPIVASDGGLLGVVALGERQSGRPYLREDEKLLTDIAGTAALRLELWRAERRMHSSSAERGAAEVVPENARECSACGTVAPSFMVFCGTCSRKLDPAPIPYRGTDLGLGRPIAAKTLRRVSPEHALRLRHEARVASRVQHPHIASFYGLETWMGTPLLIMEFLEGGVLADRFERGPLGDLEVVRLGIAMADALASLHAKGILHRDVKPSNIGFTETGVPKLMDFGIARGIHEPGAEPLFDESSPEEMSLLPPTRFRFEGRGSSTPPTRSRQLVGTLHYLSPDVLDGRPVDECADLWSLDLVLLESRLGRRIFTGDDPKQVMARIQLVRVPDLAAERPDAALALAAFFRDALHRQRTRRPASAKELVRRLRDVERQLAMT